MSRFNPLFVDSTRPIGDKVVTRVELGKILLYDDEVLYFEVLDNFSFSQRFLLSALDAPEGQSESRAENQDESQRDVKFGAEVWLKYQHQVSYRYVVEIAGGQLEYVSAAKQTRAGHVISDQWEPTFSEKEDAVKEQHEVRRAEFLKALDSTTTVKEHFGANFPDPHYFEKIKTLIDDLF